MTRLGFTEREWPSVHEAAGRISGLVIQELRHLGQRHVDQAVIKKLRRRIPAEERQGLCKDAALAPAWTAEVMREIGTGGVE